MKFVLLIQFTSFLIKLITNNYSIFCKIDLLIYKIEPYLALFPVPDIVDAGGCLHALCFVHSECSRWWMGMYMCAYVCVYTCVEHYSFLGHLCVCVCTPVTLEINSLGTANPAYTVA